MKPLLDDEYLFPIISLIVAIYAVLARPKTPKFLYNLFQNPLFRLVAISYIAYRSTKNFQSALLIAAAFLSTMHFINKGSLNFLADNFTNSSNTTSDFTEYFDPDATPANDEPVLDFAYDDNGLLAENFANEDPDLNEDGEERFGNEEQDPDLNDDGEERFANYEQDPEVNEEEERFGNNEQYPDVNEDGEERFGNEEQVPDLNEDGEERFGDEEQVPELNEDGEERFGNEDTELNENPSGSCGSYDFASF
jgi:hypothetical protein